MRGLVRWMISPVVRWASHGGGFRFYACSHSGGGGALGFWCPFGAFYEAPLTMTEAKQIANDLIRFAYFRAEGVEPPNFPE